MRENVSLLSSKVILLMKWKPVWHVSVMWMEVKLNIYLNQFSHLCSFNSVIFFHKLSEMCVCVRPTVRTWRWRSFRT